ncbi:MAG: hypothetical protein ABIJ48_03875 [Actinomycetota bacterium]
MREAAFHVYGRFLVHLARSADGWWRAAEIGCPGKTRPLPEVLGPDHARVDGLPGYLEAAFHELARPGEAIVRVR